MAITTNSKILASDVSGKVDTAGTGLSKSGTTLSLKASGVTAGSYGPSANASPAHGKTFSVPYLTVDTYGRLTACSTKTITLPAAGAASATAYVTTTGGTAPTWWRKWSNGFIEQGGRATGGKYNSQGTLSFPVAFKNTNYTIVGTAQHGEHNSDGVSFKDSTKLSTAIEAITNYNGDYGGTYPYDWYACGF